MRDVHNIADLRRLARRRLPRGLFEYVDRGAEDERAVAGNRDALARLRLRPRVLRDVSSRSTATTLFGREWALPLAISPTAVGGMLWRDGDVLAARAAGAAGVPFTLSTASVTPIERVAAESGARVWFQLYIFGDRTHNRSLVARAKAAGCEAIVLTVDSAVIPKREYNQKNGFGVPIEYNARTILGALTHPRWSLNVLGGFMTAGGLPGMVHYPDSVSLGARMWTNANSLDASIDWADVREIRALWDGPFLIKGILHPEDAVLAARHGADGVVVSNHGGRNLDSAVSTIEALPAVVDAVAGRIPVLVDSGFRRGGDVVKALALGASAVMLGRAPLWGLAAGGAVGVARALEIFREEIDRVIGQAECARLAELGRDLVYADGTSRVTGFEL